MVCIKSEGRRTALTALAPEAHFLAAGTMSGDAVGQPSAPLATMKIYSLHVHADIPAVKLLAAAPSPDRFNRLCWSGPAAAEAASFSLGLIAGGLCDGSVAVWSPLQMISSEGQADDAMVALLEKYKAAISGLQFSVLEPNRLASGNTNGDMCIWDLKHPLEPEMKNVGYRAQAEITCIAWNPLLNHQLASTSKDGTTVVWDLRNQKSVASISDANGRRCSALQWDPEVSFQFIAASDDDNSPSLRVWDIRNVSAPVKELNGHSKGVIAMSWCSYDSSFLLSGDKDSRTICWDTVRGEIISEAATCSNNNFDLYWYRERPVAVAVSLIDGSIGIRNLEFSGNYAAGDSAVGASARARARAPKWLKCPTQAGTAEVHGHNLVEVNVGGKGQQLTQQTVSSGDTMNIRSAKAFVEMYYTIFNGGVDHLHELYLMGSTANWPNSDGEMKTVSGTKALENLFASKSEVCKDFVLSTIDVHTNQNACLLAVVNGRFTNAGGRLTKFSQSFLLTQGMNGDFSILSDVMNFHGLHQDVCVIYDEEMIKHCGIDNEQPERITSIMRKFNDYGLLQRVVVERAGPIKDEEILSVHLPRYLAFIKDMPLSDEKKEEYSKLFDAENIAFSDGTLKAVLLSAGAVVKACKLVATGRYDHAFAVVRPPGHHATFDKADGFCFLNNIAIGAKELLRIHGINKIVIVDFDVHHGDGTQSIFYEDDRVLFFSTHKDKDFYPLTSSKKQHNIGTGRGIGHNINICLPNEFGNDDLLVAVKYVLLPVIKSFSPDVILVSAGFDAAKGDPVGHCNVTPPCYGTVIDWLKKSPSKRGLALALEGGYDLGALAESATSCLKSLLGDPDDLLTHKNYWPLKNTWRAVTQSRKILSPHWSVLSPEIPQEVLARYKTKAPKVVAPEAALQPPAAGERGRRQSRRKSVQHALGRAAQEKDPGKSKGSQLHD